jgi:hypothetical protein
MPLTRKLAAEFIAGRFHRRTGIPVCHSGLGPRRGGSGRPRDLNSPAPTGIRNGLPA